MKSLRRLLTSLLIGLLGVVFCGCQTAVLPAKKPLPVAATDLLGPWVGFTEDDIYFFRMDLQPDGRGLCAYAFGRTDAKLLAITQWSTQRGRIRIELSPIDPDPNQVTTITGTAHASVMHLTVSGKDWQRRLVMRREEDLERRAELVKSRMRQYRPGS